MSEARNISAEAANQPAQTRTIVGIDTLLRAAEAKRNKRQEEYLKRKKARQDYQEEEKLYELADNEVKDLRREKKLLARQGILAANLT